MDMAQSKVMQSGSGHLGLGNGVIGRAFLGGIAMENANVIGFRALRPEVFQEGRAVHGSEAGTVYPAIQIGKHNAFYLGLGENMDIFRPNLQKPGTGRGTKIVVARGNEYGNLDFFQNLAKSSDTLRGGFTVKNIAGEQHYIAIMLPAQMCQHLR
jgi:hypothetical protein